MAAGFTQVQLGAAIGMSYVQIQKYENGVNRIAIATLVSAKR
ncbi:helix-turn-helix domain-containing protein [Phyllobacterium zundukense]|nr:helix-turn-helix transcriptional regulator [Phyllobacterium zundukense]